MERIGLISPTVRAKAPSSGINSLSPSVGAMRQAALNYLSGRILHLKADIGVLADGAADFSSADKELVTIASAGLTLRMGDIDFEIGGWVYLTTVGNYHLLTKGSSVTSEANTEYYLKVATSQLVFGVSNGTTFATITASTFGNLSAGTWYFVRAWRDKTAGTINIQVNDGAINSLSTAVYAQSLAGTPFTIGTAVSALYDYQFMNGRKDSVYVTKTLSSTAEATALYNSGNGQTSRTVQSTSALATFWTNCISFWDMNENSSTRYDAKGSNDLTAAGAEKVTNGTFTGNSTGWTEGAGWAYGTNNEAATAATADLSQATTAAVVGREYTISYAVVVTTGSVAFTFGGVTGTTRSTNGTYTQTITATTTAALAIHPVSAFTGTIDTVSVKSTGPLANAGIVAGDAQSGASDLEASVAKWQDQSGNANHAVQTTLTKRPTYVANVQNGKPVVRGDGTDDVLTYTGINLGKTHTLSIMVIPRTVTDAIIVGASSGNGYLLRADATNFYYADGVNAAVSVAHGGFTADTAYIISVIRNGAAVQFFKQGVQVGADQTLAANDTDLTIGTIFAKHDATSPLNGDIGDSVKYSTTLVATQRQANERYLSAKYAVTLS